MPWFLMPWQLPSAVNPHSFRVLASWHATAVLTCIRTSWMWLITSKFVGARCANLRAAAHLSFAKEPVRELAGVIHDGTLQMGAPALGYLPGLDRAPRIRAGRERAKEGIGNETGNRATHTNREETSLVPDFLIPVCPESDRDERGAAPTSGVVGRRFWETLRSRHQDHTEKCPNGQGSFA